MDFGSFGTFLATPSGARNVVFLLFGASFALKSAFFPVHSWLPRAHAAAPANVSALMSGVIHKAGLFAFLRFLLLFGEPEEWMGWSVLAFGAVSALLGVLYTSSQRDLKRLLGYSSTENVGIAAVGFGLALLGRAWGRPELVAIGLLGGLLHLFNHALFKCLLFYAAGAVYRATHTVDLERLGGLFRRMPWTAVLFGIGALAISGLPPMNGFVSELLLLAGLFGGGAPTPAANAALVCTAALLGFVGAVSALSMVRAFGVAFLGTPRDRGIHVVGDAPWVMRGPMVLHAVGILLVGVLPVLVVQSLAPVAALFGVDGAALGTVVAILTPVQTGCRVLVVFVWISAAVGFAMGHEGRSSVTWGCGYTAGTPRIQYTASSFSATFVDLFATLLPSRRRVQLSTRILPRKTGHFAVSAVDAVERRLFEVLGRGEELFVRAAAAVPEEPRVAFAGGLALLLVLVAALLAGGAR
jgi:hydrogenase-4 component B